MPSERLIDEVWGDEPPETARKSLQVRVSNLRKALRARRSAGSDPLASLSGGYVIRLGPDQLDLHRFERLLEEAADAAARQAAEQAAELLRDALNLWRGPALGDLLDNPFVQLAAGRLEELRLMALESRIEADLELGRHAKLVGEVEALVAQHPFRERLRGQLILALYRAGRQADALAAYRAARHALIDNLGIEPSPLLQQLEKRILRQDPALELAGVPPPDHAILIAARDENALAPLLELGTALTRRSGHELIVVRPIPLDGDVARASALLNEQREALSGDGFATRVAPFTSARPGDELVRIATEHEVDLLLLDGHLELARDDALREVLERSPCDVAVLTRPHQLATPGPVLVPFTGADHDWAAVELGAWIAAAWHAPLRLAGAAAASEKGTGDASRLLAHAALAVQRGLGVVTEPILIPATSRELVRAAGEAALVVFGMPDHWRREGLGAVRLEVAREATPRTLLVRRGPRPGGHAPRESRTRFTWSLGPQTAHPG